MYQLSHSHIEICAICTLVKDLRIQRNKSHPVSLELSSERPTVGTLTPSPAALRDEPCLGAPASTLKSCFDLLLSLKSCVCTFWHVAWWTESATSIEICHASVISTVKRTDDINVLSRFLKPFHFVVPIHAAGKMVCPIQWVIWTRDTTWIPRSSANCRVGNIRRTCCEHRHHGR